MAIEFVKSAKRIAFEKSLLLVVALIVGGAFSFVLFSGITQEIIVKFASAIAVMIAAFMTIAILLDINRVLADGRDWRVIISDEMLSWESPVPEVMKPFQLALSEIDKTRFTVTHFRNSKKTPDKKWEIILRNGHPMKIDGQSSGINPHKVFTALETKGITFEKISERKGSGVKISG